MVEKYWHAGIIYNSKVYECFNNARHSIRIFNDSEQKRLVTMNAIFVDIPVNEAKFTFEINSGTDCSEYVARAIGMSKNLGSKKEYWSEQVYDYIRSHFKY